MEDVPLIDLSAFREGTPAARRETARRWGEAFETIGFASIVGHGVHPGLMEEVHAAGMRFFDLPAEAKLRCSFLPEKTGQGYVPQGVEAVARTHADRAAPADLCEALTFYNLEWEWTAPANPLDRSLFRPNRWPDSPDGFAGLLRRYHTQVYALGRALMRLSALALELREDYFDPFYDRMASTLRLVHYPDQPAEPLPGQLRYGAHTDYTGFTILRQDDAPGGLQVLRPGGRWVDVAPVRGAFVINIGDLLALWTNDRWKSTVHRVINPPRHLTGSTRRLSIVLFTGPNQDARIECLPSCAGPGQPPRYQPVIVREHLMAKIRASMTP